MDDDFAALRVEDRLSPGAAVGVGEEGLEVGGQEPLRASLESLSFSRSSSYTVV